MSKKLKFFTATPMYQDKPVGPPIRIEVDTEWAGEDENTLRDAAYDVAHNAYDSLFSFKIEETI